MLVSMGFGPFGSGVFRKSSSGRTIPGGRTLLPEGHVIKRAPPVPRVIFVDLSRPPLINVFVDLF